MMEVLIVILWPIGLFACWFIFAVHMGAEDSRKQPWHDHNFWWYISPFNMGSSALPAFIGFSFFPVVNVCLAVAWFIWYYNNRHLDGSMTEEEYKAKQRRYAESKLVWAVVDGKVQYMYECDDPNVIDGEAYVINDRQIK